MRDAERQDSVSQPCVSARRRRADFGMREPENGGLRSWSYRPRAFTRDPFDVPNINDRELKSSIKQGQGGARAR